MADGINWGVNTPNYGGFAPQPINWGALADQKQQQQKPQQQPQQPGQPLNITPEANQQQPTWFDRLKSFFAGNAEGMSPQPYQPPNPPVPSGTAQVGVGPGGPPAAPVAGQQFGSDWPPLSPVEDYLMRRYGAAPGTVTPNRIDPSLLTPYPTYEQGRQAGGPVAPGYARRVMPYIPPGYTAGAQIG